MKKIYLHGAKEQIARHSTIRDINKQIVLNYVRVRAPISRAEIARETSLQRSTVSAIVDDLEPALCVSGVGRRGTDDEHSLVQLHLREQRHKLFADRRRLHTTLGVAPVDDARVLHFPHRGVRPRPSVSTLPHGKPRSP